MPDSDERGDDAAVPEPPVLPDVESLPPEDILDEVPSTDEIIERAQSAQEIVRQQPDVDELLGRRR